MHVRALWLALTACLLHIVTAETAVGGESAQQKQREVEDALKIFERLTETRKGLSALKKIVNDIDGDLQKTHTYDDMARKRKGLEILERILNEMEADLMYEQKRTCHFNLGGHCSTESAAYVADHWHYLNSPLSPGRKRRDTRLFKSLLNGKLLQ